MTNIKTEKDERSKDLKARFVLGELSDNNLVVVGINPSIATINALDPTAKRIKKYSEIHGYTGWIIINLYPQIDPDIDELNKEKNEELVKENLEKIKTIIKRDDITLVAAWGEAIEWRKYLKDCFREIDFLVKKYNHQWNCFALTKYGHPCHPLMRKKDFRLYSCELKKVSSMYIDSLR